MRDAAWKEEQTVDLGHRDVFSSTGGARAGLNVLDSRPPASSPSRVSIEDAPEPEIATPQGWRPWGELHVGDEVFGSDGRTTVVTDAYERGRQPTYRVRFSDGSYSVVDGDQPWLLRQRGGKYADWRDLTMTTAELLLANLQAPTYADGRSRGWRFTIPMAGPIQYPTMDLPVEPYTLGALIANGGLTGSSATLTTPDHEVVTRIRRHYAIPAWRPSAPGEVCARGTVRGTIASIRRLGLDVHSADKFIPATYLRGDVEQRVALLQGLMDGDGASRGARRASVLYFTSSEALVREMRELVTSLGGTASARWYTRPGRRPEASMGLMLPRIIEPFHTSAKRRGVPQKVTQPRRAIVGVQPHGEGRIRSFSVAAPDGLYVVGRDHVLTHNGTSWPMSPTSSVSTRPC
ncbi:hypothetical protein [Phycicoccus sp. Soil803]|uniref:hypothetical protein n=1 Tax=Phycicoccus sp. Soil803 TaxID=1736415 RepID=UPI00070AB905|nr:hypothetical protein [Phycicoccus sp. Soil803]KRF24770.1 hypothetical protein ASG95_09825 [Phycicoccus sp. Soil803]